MIVRDQKTARQDPSGKRWVVLLSRMKFWKAFAGWSAVLFALSAGAAAIGIALWTGGGIIYPAPVWFIDRSAREEAAMSAEGDEVRDPEWRRVIDGMPLGEEGYRNNYYAVIIDNLEEARPASGLSKAPLVVELPVEGGITRFLAFFDADGVDVERIGPVRSARPYFIDWAEEFDAILVHVGGSNAALQQLKGGDLRDLNQYYWGRYFWRDPSRFAPHNAYTSLGNLRQVDDLRFPEYSVRDSGMWAFKDGGESVDPDPGQLRGITIEYGKDPYRVHWEYEPGSNSYVRYQGGTQQTDRGAVILARNVVVQYTKVTILDYVGRREIQTRGSGDAVVLRDGDIIYGSWQKDEGDRIRFLDADSEEIVLNAGTTWIEVVPSGTLITEE